MLISLDEFCDRTHCTNDAREDFRAFVAAKGMESKQSSNTWRRLWNEFK